MIKTWKEILKDISDPNKQYSDSMVALSEAGIAGAKAGKTLKDAIMDDMMTQYKSFVGHLPGSNKTKRLKKKRINAVLKWYINQN